jgi:hypothetical protein
MLGLELAYIQETYVRLLRGESKEQIYDAMDKALGNYFEKEEDKKRFMDIVYAKAYTRMLINLGKLASDVYGMREEEKKKGVKKEYEEKAK